MRRYGTLLLALGIAIGAAACGPDLDLTRALELKVLESGYFDDGIHDGQVRFLPSLTFEIHNNTDASIASVQLLLSYYQQGADGEYDSQQAAGIGSEGVAPGAATPQATVRAQHGYAFPGARADFFTNSLFRDIVVKVFAKKRAGYMPLGEFKIDRRILEPSGKSSGTR